MAALTRSESLLKVTISVPHRHWLLGCALRDACCSVTSISIHRFVTFCLLDSWQWLHAACYQKQATWCRMLLCLLITRPYRPWYDFLRCVPSSFQLTVACESRNKWVLFWGVYHVEAVSTYQAHSTSVTASMLPYSTLNHLLGTSAFSVVQLSAHLCKLFTETVRRSPSLGCTWCS